jgi:Ser/Thr protein kinase RdoA (MazF antagonist)
LKPAEIKPTHVEAAKTFGATRSPEELKSLLDKAAEYEYRRGPVHGDLTPENVRVRNGEAILIDFYKSRTGPLVADLASLEVAICFSIEAGSKWNQNEDGKYVESVQFKEWQRHIDTLFTFKSGEFGMVPPLQERPCGHTWMWSACRQLRLMAYYIEPNEKAYAYVLAAYLLRMATFPTKEDKIIPDSPDAVVRAYAYWSAERMLDAIASHEGAS